ncbi:MAG: NUDIX hydrolase [Vicingaceae bacterium]
MKVTEKRFNIRVYGILINQQNQVLLSSENRKGFSFTKFPGGGLHWGEGIADCLKREWMEELGLEIKIKEHFYTTDFFQLSAFRENDQLLSIYYFIEKALAPHIQDGQIALDVEEGNTHHFHWESLASLEESELSFPIDQKVIRKLKAQYVQAET